MVCKFEHVPLALVPSERNKLVSKEQAVEADKDI